MSKNRRRQYYIDRLFQRRFLWLFLMLVVIITICNLMFYFGLLRPAVDDAMFRSHIQVDNPVNIVTGLLSRFIPVIVLLVTVLTVGLYSIFRVRLERFLGWLTNHLQLTMEGGQSNTGRKYVPIAQFQDLEPTLLWFLYHVHEQEVSSQEISQKIRAFSTLQSNANRKALLKALDWEQ
ncbi:MAG: hypothetical protein GXO70_09835 [Acidobacteria bacterium]|nr:hypothetical protein [Acidobacteriota bacterium]